MITTIVVGLVLLGSIAVLAKIVVNKFEEIKGDNMSVEAKIEDLKGAVSDLAARVAALPSAGVVAELEEAIRVEREAAANLAIAEDAEDVDQNAALADAKSEVDRLVAEALAAEAAIDGVKSDVEAIATAPVVVEPEIPAEPKAPVVDEPVVEPVPAEPVVEDAEDVIVEDDVVEYEGEPATATDEDGNPVSE